MKTNGYRALRSLQKKSNGFRFPHPPHSVYSIGAGIRLPSQPRPKANLVIILSLRRMITKLAFGLVKGWKEVYFMGNYFFVFTPYFPHPLGNSFVV